MTAWQRRVRALVAIFGIAVAVVVYLSIGTRRTPSRPAPMKRLDEKVTAEADRGKVQQNRLTARDFQMSFEKVQSYEDGSSKWTKPQINVQKPDGRTFVVTADEARSGPQQKQKELTGHVKLVASDGFEMTADQATHSEDDAIVRVPGAVQFKKGHMSGSGTNGTYDQNSDILTIAEQAAVTVTDGEGHPTTEFTSGSAMLDRLQHGLTLDMHVHVVRGMQIIDTDHSSARLNANNDVVTYIELRGQSRVTGGSAIRSMSARDIDMDYSEDGRTLERVVLNGNAQVTPTSNGESTRSMAAESLDVLLAKDGSIVSATGRENVRLDLPPSGDSPGGRITARTMDASGQEGRGLTDARFTDAVEYREPARKGASPRVVRARTLAASLDGDAVKEAAFTGNVIFEESDLKAGAPEARYQPAMNAIALAAPDGAGVSHVTIDQIEIDAKRVNVALDSRQISATQVKTTLRPKPATSRGSDGRASSANNMPGLLKQDSAANVNADALDYTSASGKAVYKGNARLFQGSTSISGDTVTVDREHGDLTAIGNVRSTLDLETGRVTGSGDEIRYVDNARTVTYSVAPAGPTRGRGVGSPGAPPGGRRGSAEPVHDAQVKGPQGDLHAERIDVVLASSENRMERLEAVTRVTLSMETKSAVGSRLTYHAEGERYAISGAGAMLATVQSMTAATATTPQSCREMKGRTLTFYKATDSIEVDGNDETRTQMRNIPCPAPASR